MASKYYKGYKFVTGGNSRPGIIGVKPKSGGVVDEFKSKRLKELGRTQKRLKSQDKQVGEAMGEAKKRGATRKDLVKGKKFQRDNRRAQREGDKLRKDILRVGKAKGGIANLGGRPKDKRKPKGPQDEGERRRLKPTPTPGRPAPRRKPGRLKEQIEKARPKPGIPVGGKLKKQGPKPGTQEYVQENYLLKPPYKRKEMKKGGKALKPVDKQKNPGLAKLPTHVRNKMGYMKKGGRVRKFGGGKK